MNKLNNKGFAVSTILYGILTMALLIVALLMSHMSNNRYNTRTLVKAVEEELNRYSQTKTELNSTTKAQQEVIIPYGQAGWYKIELLGAKTGDKNGDYTSGIVYLAENTFLYFHVGASDYNSGYTEVRAKTGLVNDEESKNSRIMVAKSGAGTEASTIRGYATNADGNVVASMKLSTGQYDADGNLLYADKNLNFIDGIIISGVNTSSIGNASITKISSNSMSDIPDIRNAALNGVKRVKVCANKSDGTSGLVSRMVISYTTSNPNAGPGREFKNEKFTANACQEKFYNPPIDVDELAFWFEKGNNTTYKSIRVETTTSDNKVHILRDRDSNTNTETITSNGLHISRYQLNSKEELPNGNHTYYIVSAQTQNTALTSNYTASYQIGAHKMDYMKGLPSQKWAIEYVGDNGSNRKYKILDGLSDYRNALQPNLGNSELTQTLVSSTEYSDAAWMNWYIKPTGDGYYNIYTIGYDNENETNKELYLTANSTSIGFAAKNAASMNQKFKLINTN